MGEKEKSLSFSLSSFSPEEQQNEITRRRKMNEDSPEPEEISPPFYVQTDFPLFFIPTRAGANFDFANNDTQLFSDEDQEKNESFNENKTCEPKGTSDDNADLHEVNDIGDEHHMNDIRISQPEYSRLLRSLDFSRTRTVDVTDLLFDGTRYDLNSKSPESVEKHSNETQHQSSSSRTSSAADVESLTNIEAQESVQTNDDVRNAPHETADDLHDLHNISRQNTETSINDDSNQAAYKRVVPVNSEEKKVPEDENDLTEVVTQSCKIDDQDRKTCEQSSGLLQDADMIERRHGMCQEDTLSAIPRLNPKISIQIGNQDQLEGHKLREDILTNSQVTSEEEKVVQQVFNEREANQELSNDEESLFSSESTLSQDLKESIDTEVLKRPRHQSPSSSSFSLREHLDNVEIQKADSTNSARRYVDESLPHLNNHSEKIRIDEEQPLRNANDIQPTGLSKDVNGANRTSLEKESPADQQSTRLSNVVTFGGPMRSTDTDTWLAMLEKLELEHKQRLEGQQKQYEEYMHSLEENMKRRFEQFVLSTNSSQAARATEYSQSIDANHEKGSVTLRPEPDTRFSQHQYRPLADQIDNHHYAAFADAHSTNTSDYQGPQKSFSRRQSRDDASNLRSELSAKHARHVSDLKHYYEHEIDELKNQLSMSRQSIPSSSAARQSMETIERINSENTRLREQIGRFRHSLQSKEEENGSLRKILEDFRGEIQNRDIQLKAYQKRQSESDRNYEELNNIRAREEDRIQSLEKELSVARQTNEKLDHELSITKERLMHLEGRYRQLENQQRSTRPLITANVNDGSYVAEERHSRSAMSLNLPTSAEYGRFTLIKSRYSMTSSSSTFTSTSNDRFHADNSVATSHSPQSVKMQLINIDSDNHHSQSNGSTSRPFHVPMELVAGSDGAHQQTIVDSCDNQFKRRRELESKFDELLKKRRELESRINRIPIRGLTSTDRQLLDVLERDIQVVEQQLSSTKLELRKMNIL